jgi:hypothetical protein
MLSRLASKVACSAVGYVWRRARRRRAHCQRSAPNCRAPTQRPRRPHGARDAARARATRLLEGQHGCPACERHAPELVARVGASDVRGEHRGVRGGARSASNAAPRRLVWWVCGERVSAGERGVRGRLAAHAPCAVLPQAASARPARSRRAARRKQTPRARRAPASGRSASKNQRKIPPLTTKHFSRSPACCLALCWPRWRLVAAASVARTRKSFWRWRRNSEKRRR